MTLNKLMLTIAVGIVLTGCNDEEENVTCDTDESCVKFTILHTNDNHGRFWQNSDGEYGMPARKTLIDQIKQEVSANGGETLVLSGGDINTGVPESDMLDAEPDFVGMSDIGYDAMAVGNHEFDNPLSVLEQQRSWANFPMLAANIYNQDGTRYFDPYHIFTINGLRIAVVGLTTEDTAKIGNPQYTSSLEFRDPKVEMASVINEIEADDSADLIIAATHMGHYVNMLHGSNAPGDVALARSLEEGHLAAIIGGHSQNPVCMEPSNNTSYADFEPGDDCTPDRQNGTWIMQAHEWGKYVGRADFEYYGGELHLASYALIPVNLKRENADGDLEFIQSEIAEDDALKQRLQPYQDEGQEALDEVIATLTGDLQGERAVVRSQQTNLGRLIATAQKTQVEADFGITNSGGVRASIAEGDVTYRDVLTVQPFANLVTLATMTGSELTEYLNTVATIQGGSGGYAQFADISMTVDCQAGTVEINTINGQSFNSSASYTFTISNFSAAGGDGYPEIDPLPTGNVDADALYQYFVDQGSINATDYAPNGEIVYTNSSSSTSCVIASVE
ncbi:bifunctional UDP-sugar hydrolase/5'-nucleotidase UshA [Vibrio olivae]|uniref:Bifunctional UDP-sugar hydrolase/5'-nucleotidase UshA n=1 Tax=Vibrio olivae TaxID=1243002 RepID=A0ABV5HRN7_9VIBR